MAEVTLRVIDGADRGRVYAGLAPPVTIGREEGNIVQLNDDRVSRFHLKIQEDHNRLVLTDLESTNGTKVNGEHIQLRILRFGDMICVGRSILLFGSSQEIQTRLASLRGDQPSPMSMPFESNELGENDSSVVPGWFDEADLQTIQAIEAPELPQRLSPAQAAQLSELIEYVHLRIRALVHSVQVDDEHGTAELDLSRWVALLDLQSRLATYLREIGDPE